MGTKARGGRPYRGRKREEEEKTDRQTDRQTHRETDRQISVA